MQVAQQSLDHEQIHSFVQQMCRESVPQRMRVHRLSDTGLLRRFLANFENAVRCDGAIRFLAGKEPLGRSLPPPVRGEYLAKRIRKHHLPVLVSFAAANPDHAALAVQVGDFQFGHFRYAKSRAVHCGQHRPVLKVPRCFKQSLNFLFAQNDRQLLFVARQRNPVDLDSRCSVFR